MTLTLAAAGDLVSTAPLPEDPAAGVDAVLGSHWLQGIEVYRGRTILHRLGNFIAQQPCQDVSADVRAVYDAMSRDGNLAVLEIDPSGGQSARCYPVAASESGLAGVERRRIAEALIRVSGPLGTDLSFDGTCARADGDQK